MKAQYTLQHFRQLRPPLEGTHPCTRPNLCILTRMLCGGDHQRERELEPELPELPELPLDPVEPDPELPELQSELPEAELPELPELRPELLELPVLLLLPVDPDEGDAFLRRDLRRDLLRRRRRLPEAEEEWDEDVEELPDLEPGDEEDVEEDELEELLAERLRRLRLCRPPAPSGGFARSSVAGSACTCAVSGAAGGALAPARVRKETGSGGGASIMNLRF
mmetsp:Transcript_18231/g.49053  ORF Transcript_18231/g.49053 Transcript_18231/m.49053 type:complete len:222 (+) Transcript_18231:326-991(+)